jgi:hypothetical protein
MDKKLHALFDLYQIPTRRRIHALREVSLIASELGAEKLLELLNRALAHEEATLALENQWQRARTSDVAAKVKKIDGRVDRALTAIRDMAAAQASVSEPGEPLYERSIELLTALFPAGLHAVTTMSYAEELVEVDVILKKLGHELNQHVKALGLGALVDRLAAVAEEYREAQRLPREEMAFDRLRVARERGQSLFLRVVAVIAGTYFDETEEHERALSRLLEPIFAQNDAVGLALRHRRPLDREAIGDVSADSEAHS